MKRLFGAGLLAALALFMLLGYLGSDVVKGTPVAYVTLAFMVGLPALFSGLLVLGHVRDRVERDARREELRQQTVESEILKLAIANKGRLTAVEVAAQLALTPEGALAALDRLALRGQAEYEVTDDGVIVYSFHDIRFLGGKDGAHGLLDD